MDQDTANFSKCGLKKLKKKIINVWEFVKEVLSLPHYFINKLK